MMSVDCQVQGFGKASLFILSPTFILWLILLHSMQVLSLYKGFVNISGDHYSKLFSRYE